MNIRAAVAADQPRINALVETIWVDDRLWGPVRAGSYEVQGPAIVLVAEEAATIVGVASFLPSLRARFGLLHVDVAASHQRTGVGSALLVELRQLHRGTAMMIRVRPWDDKTLGFVARHGFSVGERVVEGWIEPSLSVMSVWIEEALSGLPDGIAVVPFDDGKQEPRDVALVMDAWYERHHPWAPSRKLTVDEAQAIYLDPAIEGTGHIAVVRGELVGAGVLVPDPFRLRPAGAHLAYVGVGAGGRVDESIIVKGLYAACLRAAGNQGLPVQIEVSNIHTAAWDLVASLPVSGLYEGLIVHVG